ncbi:MAG: DUF4282 domain-containing protein [Terricaulis sp.]
MLEIVRRFIGFDTLMGVGLVKIVYYVGLAVILGVMAMGVLLALMRLASDLGSGFVQLVAVPAVGAVALVYWRFICELFMVAFENHARLGEIRDRLSAPNYPQF